MAIQFNSSGEYVERDCSASPMVSAVHYTTAWTICAWVRRDGNAGVEQGVMGLHTGQNVSGASIIGHIGTDSVIGGFVDGNYREVTGYAVSNDEWVYLALRWRPHFTVSMADIDDVALTSNATPRENLDGSAANWISCGRFPGWSAPFTGSIAHMRAWAADLSDAEILAERSSATPVRTSGLYLAWEFVADATDSSGNARHGTVNGTVAYVAGPTLGGGASVVISGVSDSTLYSGQTGIVITGTGFGASQGSGQVIVSPTDNVNDSSAVLQTVTSWGDTSITITAVQKHLAVNVPYYLFVKTDGAVSNESGFSVMYKFLGPITPRTFARAQAATLSGTGDVTP